MNDAFLRRLWRFQGERYPVILLTATTAVYVLTLRHVCGEVWSHEHGTPALVGLILFGVLYLGHIRLFDEIRDEVHDREHYPTRPVPRGLIRTSELNATAYILMVFELGIVAWFGMQFVPYAAAVLGVTLLAAQDYFLGAAFRKHLLLYNLIMTFQSLFGLVLIALIAFGTWNVRWPVAPYLSASFGSVVFLEWIRKIRIPREENTSRDTYSARYGPLRASILGGAILAAVIGVNMTVVRGWTAGLFGVLIIAVYSMVARRYVRQLTRPAVRTFQGACLVVFFALYGIFWIYG